MSMKENEIDRILADLVAGERISAEDRQILENWKEVSGRNSRFEREMREIASSGAKLHHRRKNEIVFEQVEQVVRKRRGRVRLMRQLSVAAGIALFVGIAAYFMLAGERQTGTSARVVTARIMPGSVRAELVLPRGEVVHLDSTTQVVLAADSLNLRVMSDESTLIYGAEEKNEQMEYHTIRVPRAGNIICSWRTVPRSI